MKIIIIPNMPAMSGRHYCIAKMLVEQGHEVHYFMWDLPYRMKPKELLKHGLTSLLPKKYRHEEFTMHKVRRLPYFWPLINGWMFKRQLRKLYNDIDADIIFSESYTNETEVPKDLPFIYDLADDYAGPAEVYGGFAYKLAFKMLRVRSVMRRQCQNAKVVTVVSKILSDFARQYNDDVVTVPNGVEKKIIKKTLRAKTAGFKNPHSIVYATGFGPWSRAIETLEAVVALRKEFPDIDLTLIGDGSERENIKRFIVEHDAESYIHFLGYIYDRKKLFELISKAAIGLNISDKNAWRDASHPMKVMDYSALGLRVVSTDLTEVERLQYSNIFLFSDAGKKNGFVPTLRRALKDKKSYKDVSATVLRDYSWEKLTKGIVTIATRVKKPKAAPSSIVHVVTSYPPHLGGLENVAQVLATTESQEGLAVRVITSDQGAHGEIPKDAVPVKRLSSFVIANTTIMVGLLPELLRIKKDEIVHMHVTQAFMPEMVWIASKLKGFTYVAHIHLDVPPSGPAGFLLKIYKPAFLKRVLKRAAYVAVFTEEQKAEISRKYSLVPERVVVIPNGAEDKFYYDKKRSQHAKPRLLFVGRLNYQKNLSQLLNALEGISDQFTTTLVGDGELADELKALAKKLKLKNVTFAGRKDGKALLKCYEDADIFVLSSEREGMPLVLLEAMAMGLPIVATDVTGTRDVVKDKDNGLLVPYNDAEAFRSALLKMKSDPTMYKKMSQSAHKIAAKHSWKKIAAIFTDLYKQFPAVSETPATTSVKVWKLCLPLLVLANAAYLSKNFFGWLVTLGFFLLVPGYLMLNCLRHGIKSRWGIVSFSLGLSLFLMIVSGLLLNSLHVFGLQRPLSTLYIFIVLDIVTLVFLARSWRNTVAVPSFKQHSLFTETTLVASLLTLLPLLAIGGAIRLNNGASNILTMILFAAIAVLFLWLVYRKKLSSLYPYAIIMMAVAILFTNSLRGWYITGHDIHHEFLVFQATSQAGYWHSLTSSGDPYNACLSITILPTIIAKITTIPAAYIYKAVFQIIFACGLLPIYFFIKKIAKNKEVMAFIGSFVFISFPTFLNDMPFLNRQEVAFVFFALLVWTAFLDMARRTKTILVTAIMTGLILSHYSSSYVTIGLLVLSWVFYKLVSFRKGIDKDIHIPLLSLPIIVVALLFTFLWNMQITASSSNLSAAVVGSVKGLIDHSSQKDGFAQYSLLGTSSSTPLKEFDKYAVQQKGQVAYASPTVLSPTRLGKDISRIVNVETLNTNIHAILAKVFQVLVLIGIVVLIVRRKKFTHTEAYFCAMAIASLCMLVILTILPQLSIDYDVTRLFQQNLIILAFPMLLAAEFLFAYLGRYKMYAAAILFAVMFLDLSGFIPQALGGYLPQLPLNNSGQYYDFFYTHKSDVLASNWLALNRNKQLPIYMDTNSASPPLKYPVQVGYMNPSNGKQEYIYLNYTNVHTGVYRLFVNSGFVEYTYPSVTNGTNLIYSNQDSQVYRSL